MTKTKNQMLESMLTNVNSNDKGIYRISITPSLTGIFVKEKEIVQKAHQDRMPIEDEEEGLLYTLSLGQNIKLVTDDSLAVDVFVANELETGFNPFSQK